MDVKVGASQLGRILSEQGRDILNEPDRLEELLISRFGGQRAEIAALTDALGKGFRPHCYSLPRARLARPCWSLWLIAWRKIAA
jgi:hypothetical protein